MVLLGSHPDWTQGARSQALRLGAGVLRQAASAQEVIALLAGGFPPVTHVVLQPQAAGDLLAELVDMTAGQRAGIGLVVLGEAAALRAHPAAPGMTFVVTPTKTWLADAIGDDAAVRYSHDPGESPTVTELKEALADSRIQTRYQPIVRLDNGLPIGLEVLARMEHPSRGILQPDLFVPQIEDAGLSWPLTQAVVTRAFDDWQAGRLGGLGLTLALNFPLDVLLIPEALTWLEHERREAGLPAGELVIELTESRPVSELSKLRRSIATLRGIGYGLAIDDVGPALRDHKALLDLQFTALKLDKDLVHDSQGQPDAQGFLTHTLASAKAAGLTVIAEGVEDADTWQRMLAQGVDQAQGFLVARPLPAAAVSLWHRDWVRRHPA